MPKGKVDLPYDEQAEGVASEMTNMAEEVGGTIDWNNIPEEDAAGRNQPGDMGAYEVADTAGIEPEMQYKKGGDIPVRTPKEGKAHSAALKLSDLIKKQDSYKKGSISYNRLQKKINKLQEEDLGLPSRKHPDYHKK